jgi:hypothetical protein
MRRVLMVGLAVLACSGSGEENPAGPGVGGAQAGGAGSGASGAAGAGSGGKASGAGGGGPTAGGDGGRSTNGGSSQGGASQNDGGEGGETVAPSGGDGGSAPEPECTEPVACTAAGFDGVQACDNGTLGACELLMLELTIPDANATHQWNYSLPETSSLSFFAYSKQGHGSRKFWTLNPANDDTGRSVGTFDPVNDDPWFAYTSNSYEVHWLLGGFEQPMVSLTTDLSAATPTRWEVDITSNHWATINQAPPTHSWDRGLVLRVYGTP